MRWISTYIGPPEYIIHDAGTNFTSMELCQNASSLGIMTKGFPVEAHWSIEMVERYHSTLRIAYLIIEQETRHQNKELALEIFIKAINNTAGPDGLIPTLLVSGAYPKMTRLNPPSPSIFQRSTAIHKAMKEIHTYRAKKQVADALNQRNGPVTLILHDLPLNSDVLVQRENGIANQSKWTGPFKSLEIEDETCKVELPDG